MNISHEAAERWFQHRDFSLSVVEECRMADPAGTLFFLHGRFGYARLWQNLFKEVGSSFRCIALNLPGFQGSLVHRTKTPSLLEVSWVVEQVVRSYACGKPGSVVLVGHDYGGAIAQLCGLRCPDEVAGMVLFNSSCLTQSPQPAGWFARRHLKKALEASEGLSEEARALVFEPWRRFSTRHRLLRALRAIEKTWPDREEQRGWLERIQDNQMPVLLLRGSHDPLNVHCELELLRCYPEIGFFEDAESGHFPFLENPEWVAQKMREFLFRLPCGRTVGDEPQETLPAAPRQEDQNDGSKDHSPAA
jgi:pimeloyl-ACP methyl ester carboxylesterase